MEHIVARVLISGSPDGLGLMAARLLVGDGHEVARRVAEQANAQRDRQIRRGHPQRRHRAP
jgi:NAD(P)-dependent dehydrogenase (short-subunit alcohol dehydrogenase family)